MKTGCRYLLRGWQGQLVKKEVAEVAFNHLQGGDSFAIGVVQHSFALGTEGRQSCIVSHHSFKQGGSSGGILHSR